MNPPVQSNRRGSLDHESEILPQSPPAAIVRWIAFLLIAMFGVALVAAFVVRLPETVRCPFVLMPKDGADPIQAPFLGDISAVRITEGQEVAAGEELFALHSEEIRTKHTQFRTFTEDLRAKEDGAEKSEALHVSQLRIKDAEIAQVERELTFRTKHVDASRALVTRLAKLAQSGGISQIELARLELELAGSEKDRSITEKNLEAVKLERERIGTERARQRISEAADVQNLKSRIEALRRDLESSKQDLLSIRAPYDAVVISLSQRNVGSVVQAGQELCQLARRDATPRARLMLKENGLPRLAVGQRVRLFLDAFPYQRYGTITGQLDWISPAAVASPGGPGFVAAVTLDRTTIGVHGEPRPVRVGMKGEARIIVGSRAPIEYAFEPIRALRENMRH